MQVRKGKRMKAEQKPVGLYHIEDDMTETWVKDFASIGLDALEAYLQKHLAFAEWLDDNPQAGTDGQAPKPKVPATVS